MSLVDLEISAKSTTYVKTQVTAVVNGVAIDPTGDAVSMAFVAIGADPASGDWKTGSWETYLGRFYARCLVGPAGTIQFTAGTVWEVWVKIVDSPEIPVIKAGVLSIV